MKWASWANLLLGASLAAQPVLVPGTDAIATAHVVTGAIVVGMALLSIVSDVTFDVAAWINLACGAWIVFAPGWLGYTIGMRSLASLDVAAGLAITALASIRIGAASRRLVV